MPIRTNNPFENLLEKIDPSKNVFVQKLVDAQNSGSLPVAFGPTLKDFPGKWREKFTAMESVTANTPLVVEIGCHYGNTLVDLAQDHPDVLFVGIDITFKRVVSSAEKAKSLGLKNVLVILANASGLDELFTAGEATGFVTFFPDPWKKKKQARNRLYAPPFCNAAWRILSDGGFLWLKTDQEPYFREACSHTADAGFRATEVLPLFGTKDYSSAFMRRYELQKLPWFGRKWVKAQA